MRGASEEWLMVKSQLSRGDGKLQIVSGELSASDAYFLLVTAHFFLETGEERGREPLRRITHKLGHERAHLLRDASLYQPVDFRVTSLGGEQGDLGTDGNRRATADQTAAQIKLFVGYTFDPPQLDADLGFELPHGEWDHGTVTTFNQVYFDTSEPGSAGDNQFQVVEAGVNEMRRGRDNRFVLYLHKNQFPGVQ